MPALNPRPAQFDRASQHRRGLIAKIHVAKKQLALAEDDYRQILFDETGRMSSADCDERQLEKVIDRLKRVGFKPVPRYGAKTAATHPMARKARALWISLHHLGVVRNASEEAFEAFAMRQLGCDRLVWARQSDAFRLIEALKNMAVRNGWPQVSPNGAKLSVVQLQEGLCLAILAKLKVAGIAADAWTLQIAAYRLTGFVAPAGAWSAEAYGELAKALGAKLPAGDRT